MPYILAHDLGTTGDKATLYDEDGVLRGTAFSAYETRYPHTGWAEQDPNDWWEAFCGTTRRLLHETSVTPHDIAGVSFSGQMQGLVAVGRNCKPIRDAIIWADHRAANLIAHIDARRVYDLSGHRLSASYTAAKARWLQIHEPAVASDAAAYLQAKDAMVARLTGVFATDRSDASCTNLNDIAGGDWSPELLETFGVPREKLPPICPSTTVVGEIHRGAAAETGLRVGTPVVIGGGDGSCAAAGAGAVEPGDAYTYIGSSSWIMAAASAPTWDPEMRTVTWAHLVPGLFVVGGAMQAGGASYQWARNQLGRDLQILAEQSGEPVFELLNREAEQSPPGARGALFLPYLLGERSPRWNPHARAAFVGLTMRHRRADLLRAVLEGVSFNLRAILEALVGQGIPIAALRAIGGGAQSVLWSRVLSDVFQLPVHVLAIREEATSMGAAVAGGIGVGLWRDFSKVHDMARVDRIVEPSTVNRELYDTMFRLFDRLYSVMMTAGIFDDMAALDSLVDTAYPAEQR